MDNIMIEYMMRELHILETIYWSKYMIKQLYKKKLYYKIMLYLGDFIINKLYDE